MRVVAPEILVRLVIDVVPRLIRRVVEVQTGQVRIVGLIQVVTRLVSLES